jgi:RNA polymerase sigma-70 factor (ECF subfamily)
MIAITARGQVEALFKWGFRCKWGGTVRVSTPCVESSPGAEDQGSRRDIRQLVLAAQQDDPRAFGEIYARCADRIHKYVTVMLRDPMEAEDIVQQTFIRAFEALPRFEMRDEAHFYGWLFRIARNAALNHRRKYRRIDTSEDVSMRVEWELLDASLTADARVGWIEDVHLMEGFERLPALQRQVLVLRFLLDMETDKIASTLSITPTNVRTAQSRAISSLRVRASARTRGQPAKTGRVSALPRVPAGTAWSGLRR